MKSILLLSAILLSLNIQASDWLCINNVGVEQNKCLSIDNPRSCNNQGSDGLDCFWHYNAPGGACYSEYTEYADECAEFTTSYDCENFQICKWSGKETTIDPYEPEPMGVCAQVGNSSSASCGSLNRSSCLSSSDCAWVEL